MARKQRKKPTSRADGTQGVAGIISESADVPLHLSASPLDVAVSTGSGEPESRPTKRPKFDHDSPLPTSLTETSTAHDSAQAMPGIPANLGQIASSLPSEVKHLQGEFEISTISVISSSKINQKVKALLDLVEKFTFADLNARPGIVVVEAKAAVASKMISVIEIAKADITKRHGRWYEYTKLRSELLPLKVKVKQQQHPVGKTPIDGEDEHDAIVVAPQTFTMKTANDLRNDQDMDFEEDGEAFETMQQPFSSPPMNGRAKVRAIPVMTVYFSCVPVPRLKDLYGEQTNA